MFTRCHNAISAEVCRSFCCGFAVRMFTFSEHKLLGFNSLEYAKPHGGEHSIINSCSMPALQFLQGRFTDVVFQCDKKKECSLCVIAFVSVSPNFFGISSGGVIFFFFSSRCEFFRQSDTFQSSKLVWLTHFLPKAIWKIRTCADCTLTGQYSSTTEGVCLHSECVVLCCEPRRAAKKAGSKASLAASTVKSTILRKALMHLFIHSLVDGTETSALMWPVNLRVSHLATETQLHNRLTVKQTRLIQPKLSWRCLTRSVSDSFTLSVRMFLCLIQSQRKKKKNADCSAFCENVALKLNCSFKLFFKQR